MNRVIPFPTKPSIFIRTPLPPETDVEAWKKLLAERADACVQATMRGGDVRGTQAAFDEVVVAMPSSIRQALQGQRVTAEEVEDYAEKAWNFVRKLLAIQRKL